MSNMNPSNHFVRGEKVIEKVESESVATEAKEKIQIAPRSPIQPFRGIRNQRVPFSKSRQNDFQGPGTRLNRSEPTVVELGISLNQGDP